MAEVSLGDLERRLGHVFAEPALLERAISHASASATDNERLEFLGDAVLGLIVSDLLEAAWPDADEGLLSRRRASLINEDCLARKAGQLELASVLRLGRGEEKTGGRKKPSILAGAFEAVLGALFRDGGIEAARRMVELCFKDDLQMPIESEVGDFKSRLQEWTQGRFRAAPVYELVEAEGPPHARCFTAEVRLQGEALGRGEGGSRKQAEQEAARAAMFALESGVLPGGLA